MEAVFAALYALVQVVDNLVQFGQIAGSIVPGSDQDAQIETQLAGVESTLEGLGQEIQQYCTQILAALSTLDQEVFGNQMAGYLSDADQAGIALAEWEQNQSSAAQSQALNSSEAGLAGIVEEYNNSVYPETSMMIVLTRAMLQRIAVLNVFPSFRAPADNQQMQTALNYLSGSVAIVTAYVQSMNQVHVNSQYHWVPLPSGHGGLTFWTVTVSYSNMLGDKTYSKTVIGTTLQAAMAAAQPYIAQADQVQAQGLPEDLAHAQVTSLDTVIQQIRQWIG